MVPGCPAPVLSPFDKSTPIHFSGIACFPLMVIPSLVLSTICIHLAVLFIHCWPPPSEWGQEPGHAQCCTWYILDTSF